MTVQTDLKFCPIPSCPGEAERVPGSDTVVQCSEEGCVMRTVIPVDVWEALPRVPMSQVAPGRHPARYCVQCWRNTEGPGSLFVDLYGADTCPVCGGEDTMDVDRALTYHKGMTTQVVESLEICDTPIALAHVTHSAIKDVLQLSLLLRRKKFGY